MEKNIYKHVIFRRDNTNYTFLVESALPIGKVRIVGYKRDDSNNRIDMAEVYIDYKKFMSISEYIEAYFKNGSSLSKKYVFGEDGSRHLFFNLSKKNGKPELFFSLFDGIIPTKHEKYKNYTGKISFALRESEDIIEFLMIKDTINHWELANINRILDRGFKQKDDGQALGSFAGV